MNQNSKIPLSEKIGYGLGDAAANIAWRGTLTFLFIFYTDVFGLDPITATAVLATARFSDGISDVIMGIVGDHTQSKYGKFRPWILWTAIPLGLILALLFTTPNFGETGKIIYAYVTYVLFTLIYTANNIPYGAMLGVMTDNHKERTSFGSFRMTGAFAGGMLVQASLLLLVVYFGNVNPKIEINNLAEDKYQIEITANKNVESVGLKTNDGIATFQSAGNIQEEATRRKNFTMEAGKTHTFIVEGEQNLTAESFRVIDQKKGYSNSMFLMSALLALLMLVTFATTRERVLPPKTQKFNLTKDFFYLLTNKPWIVLTLIGLFYNIYFAIKHTILLVYFTHYLNNELLSASYLIALGLVSIAGALLTAPLSKRFGKRNLFVWALLFSGILNAGLWFCGPNDTTAIFSLGIASEFFSAIFPTLFFVMLGDVADYSEWKNNRRATGLIYSAGSFATKFGSGIAAVIIGYILDTYHYNGTDFSTIPQALPAIKMLMSWIPSIMCIFAVLAMLLYPLTSQKMEEITNELSKRRALKTAN